MKKRVQKSLILARETLRNLDQGAMRRAAGGYPTLGQPGTCDESCLTDVTCATCHGPCSILTTCC